MCVRTAEAGDSGAIAVWGGGIAGRIAGGIAAGIGGWDWYGGSG